MGKISLVENDTSTYADEVILSLITLVALGIGIALVVCKPSIAFIESGIFAGIGIIFIILSVMYIPCIIYRFLNNDKKEK